MKTLKLLFACFLVIGLLGMNVQADLIMVPGDYDYIQDAVDAASPGDTIMVGEYEGPGAVIDKQVEIVGSGNGTVVNAGFRIHPDSSTNPTKSAFFIPAGISHAADGTIISNLKIECSADCALGVYARDADDITVSHLTMIDTQQGITNRAGSGWEITHNKFDGLIGYRRSSHIGIFVVGENDWDANEVTNNLVAFNHVDGTNTDRYNNLNHYRYGIYLKVESASVLNNKVVQNKSEVTGGRVGLSIGIMLRDDSGPEDEAVMANNAVGFNDVRGSDWGLGVWPQARWQELLDDNIISRNLGDGEIFYFAPYQLDCPDPSPENRSSDGISPTEFNSAQ
jgi:hypothetical protein